MSEQECPALTLEIKQGFAWMTTPAVRSCWRAESLRELARVLVEYAERLEGNRTDVPVGRF